MPVVKRSNNLLVKQLTPIEKLNISFYQNVYDTILELIIENGLQEKTLLELSEKAIKFDNNLYTPIIVDNDYTTRLYDGIIFVKADNHGITITLDSTNTQRVLIKKISGNYDVIINDINNHPIDGKNEVVISNIYDSYELVFTNNEWYIV